MKTAKFLFAVIRFNANRNKFSSLNFLTFSLSLLPHFLSANYKTFLKFKFSL